MHNRAIGIQIQRSCSRDLPACAVVMEVSVHGAVGAELCRLTDPRLQTHVLCHLFAVRADG